jgi:hypothetical protein
VGTEQFAVQLEAVYQQVISAKEKQEATATSRQLLRSIISPNMYRVYLPVLTLLHDNKIR